MECIAMEGSLLGAAARNNNGGFQSLFVLFRIENLR
jgi:hypothetical protein